MRTVQGVPSEGISIQALCAENEACVCVCVCVSWIPSIPDVQLLASRLVSSTAASNLHRV
jgi:hypothetical protein